LGAGRGSVGEIVVVIDLIVDLARDFDGWVVSIELDQELLVVELGTLFVGLLLWLTIFVLILGCFSFGLRQLSVNLLLENLIYK